MAGTNTSTVMSDLGATTATTTARATDDEILGIEPTRVLRRRVADESEFGEDAAGAKIRRRTGMRRGAATADELRMMASGM